jgi:hypothetical protein
MLLMVMAFWAVCTDVSADPAGSIFAVNIEITLVELTLYIRGTLEVSYGDLDVSRFGMPVIQASSHLPSSLLHFPLPKKKLLTLLKSYSLTHSLRGAESLRS